MQTLYPNPSYQPLPTFTSTEGSQTDGSTYYDEETGVWIREKTVSKNSTSIGQANVFIFEDVTKDNPSEVDSTDQEATSCFGWLVKFCVVFFTVVLMGRLLGVALLTRPPCEHFDSYRYSKPLFTPCRQTMTLLPTGIQTPQLSPVSMMIKPRGAFPPIFRGPGLVLPSLPPEEATVVTTGDFDMPTEVTRFVDELNSLRYIYHSQFVESIQPASDPCLPCFFNDSSRISRRRNLGENVDAFMVYRTTDLPIFQTPPTPASLATSEDKSPPQLLRFTVITHTYTPLMSWGNGENPFFSFLWATEESASIQPEPSGAIENLEWNEIPVTYQPKGLHMGWERGIISGETSVSFCSSGSRGCLLKVVLKGNPSGSDVDSGVLQMGHPQIGEFEFTVVGNANEPPYPPSAEDDRYRTAGTEIQVIEDESPDEEAAATSGPNADAESDSDPAFEKDKGDFEFEEVPEPSEDSRHPMKSDSSDNLLLPPPPPSNP